MGAAKPPASAFAPIDGGRVRGLGAGFKALQRLHAVAVGVCPPVQPRVQQHADWRWRCRPSSTGDRMNSTRRKRLPQREPSRGGPVLDPGGGLEGVCRPVDVSPAAPPYHWPPATRKSGM